MERAVANLTPHDDAKKTLSSSDHSFVRDALAWHVGTSSIGWAQGRNTEAPRVLFGIELQICQ